MTITITINTDNAAFEDSGWTLETARILREAARRIQHNDPEETEDSFNLYDINGNTVGRVEVKND